MKTQTSDARLALCKTGVAMYENAGLCDLNKIAEAKELTQALLIGLDAIPGQDSVPGLAARGLVEGILRGLELKDEFARLNIRIDALSSAGKTAPREAVAALLERGRNVQLELDALQRRSEANDLELNAAMAELLRAWTSDPRG